MLIRKILAGAFGYIYEYKTQLSKTLFIPLFIIAAIGLYESDPESFNWPIFVSAFTAEILISTIIAITTHRIILLGPSSVPEWGLFKLTKREFIFLLYSIGIGLIMFPIVFFTFIPKRINSFSFKPN